MTVAIDVHVHVRTGDRRKMEEERIRAATGYFGSEHTHMTPDQMAEYYQERDMKAVIFDVDAESATGLRISNDEIASWVRKYPDTFMGFASVDPWKGKAAVREIERSAKELGLIGLKFAPVTQEAQPNDPRFYPIYEKAQELGMIALFHTGTTGIGAGSPGGGGIKLKYSRPIPYIDDVAADFPGLKIIGAHPGFPWHLEMLAMARHKGNVYMDLSGWAPKYFPPETVHYANSVIKDKVLFGSDFPWLTPDRWMKEFSELALKEEVRAMILKDNAMKLFGLA